MALPEFTPLSSNSYTDLSPKLCFSNNVDKIIIMLINKENKYLILEAHSSLKF